VAKTPITGTFGAALRIDGNLVASARLAMQILLLIYDCGEAVPALRPAGILPVVRIKGRMPSPRRQS
jgi:hypothetical protein